MPAVSLTHNATSRLKSILKDSGYSLTSPRQLVFNELQQGPITHTRLANAVIATVDRATVYRTLDLFERLGVVNRIWHGQKNQVELSEIFLPHHHHAVCQRCGTTVDIISTELEQLLARLARANEFLAVEHSVEINGYCSSCHR